MDSTIDKFNLSEDFYFISRANREEEKNFKIQNDRLEPIVSRRLAKSKVDRKGTHTRGHPAIFFFSFFLLLSF